MWRQIVWPCSVTIGKYQPFLYVACRRPKTDGSSLVQRVTMWRKFKLRQITRQDAIIPFLSKGGTLFLQQ